MDRKGAQGSDRRMRFEATNQLLEDGSTDGSTRADRDQPASSFESTGDRPLSDRQLVEASLAGQSRAFQVLYGRYQARVRSTLFQLCGADGLDDLVQDVFLRAWRGLPRFRHGSSFSTWLYRIVWNLASDRRRDLARHRSTFADPAGETTVEDLASDRPDLQAVNSSDWLQMHYRDLVQRALANLSIEAQAVVVLCDLEDLPQKEVAEILAIPLGTVKSRLFSARAQMRRFLEREGVKL